MRLRTRLRVFSLISLWLRIACETVISDTPRSSAMSFMRTATKQTSWRLDSHYTGKVSVQDRGSGRISVGCALGKEPVKGGLDGMAERGRFELPVPSQVLPLSRRARSTTLPPLRD